MALNWTIRRTFFTSHKSNDGTVTLLENLHLILEKTPRECVKTEVLPMLYSTFENSTAQVQVCRYLLHIDGGNGRYGSR